MEKNKITLEELFKDIQHSIPEGKPVEECIKCNAIGEILEYGDWVTCPKCLGQCYFPIDS